MTNHLKKVFDFSLRLLGLHTQARAPLRIDSGKGCFGAPAAGVEGVCKVRASAVSSHSSRGGNRISLNKMR